MGEAEAGMGARIVGFLRSHGAGIAIEALVNFVLPYLIYSYAEAPWGDVKALLASSAPPIASSLVEFARHRRVDAVSMLVLAGIVLSLLGFLGGGGVRFLQLREKLVTAIIGLVFLGSAAIGRPLIYELARAGTMRRSPEKLAEFEGLRVHAGFRRSMTVMTLVWGAGLLADVAVATVLIFSISIRAYLIVGPVIGYAATGGLSLWTFWYARRSKRRGEARRAAEAEAARAGIAGQA